MPDGQFPGVPSPPADKPRPLLTITLSTNLGWRRGWCQHAYMCYIYLPLYVSVNICIHTLILAYYSHLHNWHPWMVISATASKVGALTRGRTLINFQTNSSVAANTLVDAKFILFVHWRKSVVCLRCTLITPWTLIIKQRIFQGGRLFYHWWQLGRWG